MKNKAVLWVIVVLLIVCSAMSGYGYFVHVDKIKNPPPENPNKEFKLNNKLWFYSKNKELLGTYTCKNEYCGYAKSYIDDSSYETNYYKGKTDTEISLINDRYAFINDTTKKNGNDIVLYDVVNQKEVRKLTAIKNYGIGLANQLMIVRDENLKWGIMKMNNNAGMIIDFKYNFIGAKEAYDDETDLLRSDAFIVSDENGWKIISDSDADISKYFINQIYDYIDGYVITTNRGYYYLNTMSGESINDEANKGMQFVSHYVKILAPTKAVYIMDLNTKQKVTEDYFVNSIDAVETGETLNGVEVYVDGELKVTLP